MQKICAILFSGILLCSCSDSLSENEKNESAVKEVSDGTIVSGNKAKLIDAHLSKLVTNQNFSGAIFVRDQGKLILAKGYGYANRENKIPFTPLTLCCIGSITKNFTAAFILKLYQEGKLKLDDKLSQYFDNVPKDKKDITIHQLLTHSSGFHEFLENDGGDYEKIETDQFLKRAFKEPLAFKPGSKAIYTNVGFTILAIIAEKISGNTHEDLLGEFYYKTDMPSIGYAANTDSLRIAVGYEGKKRWGTLQERYKKAGGGPYWNLKGNGGLYASLYDMIVWSERENEKWPLVDSVRKLMFKPYLEEEGMPGFFFGYGCNITKSKRDTKLIDNGGSNGIYHARLIRLPEEGLVFYMVTNNKECNTNNVLPQVTELYFDGHVSANSAANLQRFENPGAEFIYKTILLNGTDHFTKNIMIDLKNNGFDYRDDMLFLEAGQLLIKENKTDEALALYKLYTKEFPKIVIAWNDLGEVHVMIGNKVEAKKCFEQALKLRPENERAKSMLKQIETSK